MTKYDTITVWLTLLFTGLVLCSNAIAESYDVATYQDIKLLQEDSVQLLFNKGNYTEAKQLLEKSLESASMEKDLPLMIVHYRWLIAIDSAMNDYQAAFFHLNKKANVMMELRTFQKEQIYQDLQKDYHIDSLQQRITETKCQLYKEQQAKRSHQHIVTVLGIIVCLLLLTILVQVCAYYRKKSYIKVLSIENRQNAHQLNLLNEQVDKCIDEEQYLSQQNASLEKSNMVKDKLLSVISHDLRSPMSSLQALLNLFNTNSIARRDLVDFFGKLLSRVENTSTMLENLLHWSQYQLSGIEPIFEDVDMQKVIDDSINFYRMQAEQKHIVIDNSLKTNVHVRADVEMLKIILRNIISNAIKFTYPGGIISIKALTKEGYVIVSIKDTGMGISPENQAKMFAMANFTTPGTEKEKGTGLGLMLCKDFVEHNHGKIWLDSKIDVGTTFYFSIPLAEDV